jgi:hypothetical protein
MNIHILTDEHYFYSSGKTLNVTSIGQNPFTGIRDCKRILKG